MLIIIFICCNDANITLFKHLDNTLHCDALSPQSLDLSLRLCDGPSDNCRNAISFFGQLCSSLAGAVSQVAHKNGVSQTLHVDPVTEVSTF